MKFLLVLLVVAVGLWMLVSRLRGPGAGGGADKGGKPASAEPLVMVQCAHCGVHLAAADALPEGSRLYCSDAHRRLGPPPDAAPTPPR